MSGSLWNSTRSYVLVAFSVAALAACSGGGGGGGGVPGGGNPTPTPGGNPTPTPVGNPTPTPTPSSGPCAGTTAAPASGNAVFYFGASCTTSNAVTGFTVSGDGHGLLIAASTADESVPFTTASAPATQAAPGTDSLDVSITAGESASAFRRKTSALNVSRKVDLRSVRSALPAAARHVRYPRLIASRKLAALLHASHRGAPQNIARKRSILPTTLNSTAGIWTLNTSNTYIQVNSTLAYAGTYGDVWVDNSLLSAHGGPLSAANVQTIGADYDNAWQAVTPVYGTPDYTATSPGSTEETNCTGSDETIFVPDPDNRQAVFVISSASNGGFGSYFDPGNLIYNDIATQCLGAESNERSGSYVQYDVNNSNDPQTQQLGQDDVAITANNLSHLIEFVGQTITNPNSNGGEFLTTGYVDSPFITEGLGTLAQDFAVKRMYPALALDVDDNGTAEQTYLSDPPAYSLTAFYGTDPGAQATIGCTGCFGDVYLFARYNYDRFGSNYPNALINSGLSGFANLANAFGASTSPQNVIADYAVATAVSGTGYTSDPRFNVTGFTTFGTFSDEFSNSLTLAGPTASGTQNNATDMTYAANLGSFLYLNLGGLPAAETIAVTDTSGSFGLEAALSQH
jgi:hypothetical protein